VKTVLSVIAAATIALPGRARCQVAVLPPHIVTSGEGQTR